MLVVILLLSLLAAIATSFVITMRSHTKSAANAIRRIQANEFAEAGLQIATLHYWRRGNALSDGLREWFDQGFDCRIGDVDIRVTIKDEGGKIDLNAASQAILESFFRGVGFDASSARVTALAIIDFRDSDFETIDGGDEADLYHQFAKNYRAKNLPFDSVDELAQIPGISPDVFTKIEQHFTVHSRRPGIDPAHASEGLVEILSRGAPHEDSLPASDQLPPVFVTPGAGAAYRVRVDVFMPGGFVFAREAVMLMRGKKQPQVVEGRDVRSLKQNISRRGREIVHAPCS